jgi:hypothetical protein
MHLLYDSKSAFGTTSLAVEDLSEYIPVLNNSSFAFGGSPELYLVSGRSAPKNLFIYARKNLGRVRGRSVDVTAAQ